MTQISAKIKKTEGNRINQCDIFHDIDIVECITEGADGVSVSYIRFPLMICLNQDCDLNSDERDKLKENSNKDCRLLHLIVAPLFNFDVFKDGQHWGDIFQTGQKYNPNRTDGKKIMNNEDPRFHFLHFEDGFELPDMVIDFKHFYTGYKISKIMGVSTASLVKAGHIIGGILGGAIGGIYVNSLAKILIKDFDWVNISMPEFDELFSHLLT